MDLLLTIWALNTLEQHRDHFLAHLENYWIVYSVGLVLSFLMILLTKETSKCQFYLMIPVKIFFV